MKKHLKISKPIILDCLGYWDNVCDSSFEKKKKKYKPQKHLMS